MGRWTQYDEDSYRLPEGVTRTAYDADTGRYTFRDQEGHIYRGAPRVKYGPMERICSPSQARPLCETGTPLSRSSTFPNTSPAPKTFRDILPSHLIISPSSARNTSPPCESPSLSSVRSVRNEPSQFVKAVRQTALPKIQVVVQNLRRSATMAKRLLRRNTGISTKTTGSVSKSQSTRSSVSTSTSYCDQKS